MMRRGVKMAGRLWNQAVTLERVPLTHTNALAPFTVSFDSSSHPSFFLFCFQFEHFERHFWGIFMQLQCVQVCEVL